MTKKSPAEPTALAVVDETKPIDLAKLDGDQICNSCKFDPDAIGARAKAMIDHIDSLDQERAQKAVLAGVYLHQVQLAMGHGSFLSWLKKHFGKSQRTAYNVMALAEKFCRSAKLFLPELVASQQLTLSLEAPAGAAQAFKQKLVKFVGPHGLTELYRRHGIIKKGGKREKSASDSDSSDTTPPPASLSPEATAYQQMVDAVKDASNVLLNDVRWSLLTPEVAAKVEPLVKKLSADFHNRLLQCRHEAA